RRTAQHRDAPADALCGRVSLVENAVEVLVGLAILVGLVGVVVPVLPGALLVWGAILVWAVTTQSVEGWAVLATATVCVALVQVVKYVVPDRRLRAAGIPRRTVVLGGLLALVGFFVIPVVGLVIGFVGGVYLAERRRLHTHKAAWQATLLAARVAGLSVLIELGGTLVAALSWFGVATFA
ncbi:MAG: DUF456 domain-containing protein, partial [Nocardioidaceae bacterium]